LQETSLEKDLGVVVSDDGKTLSQCQYVYNKAIRILGIINRTTRRLSESAYICQVNFLQLLCGLGWRWFVVKTESLSQAVFEITGLKDIRITTLNSEGHVTSSIT